MVGRHQLHSPAPDHAEGSMEDLDAKFNLAQFSPPAARRLSTGWVIDSFTRYKTFERDLSAAASLLVNVWASELTFTRSSSSSASDKNP